MDNKKSTVLLTVIAVATLLVAVVGSTFAFFAIQADSDADIEVTTTTSSGSDIFNATGTDTLTLDVNNQNMAGNEEIESHVAVTDNNNDNPIVVTLKAGSGTATCTYDLVWTNKTGVIPGSEPEDTYDAYTKTSGAGAQLEYTIQGTSTAGGSIAETNVDAITNKEGKLVLNGNEKISISNTAGSATTEQRWTFVANFYNLNVNQGVQMGKTYSANITVDNIECVNNGAAAQN